ncbi:MAG: penicillin-binding transpeptidase domain-containing protein [Massilia sp.]
MAWRRRRNIGKGMHTPRQSRGGWRPQFAAAPLLDHLRQRLAAPPFWIAVVGLLAAACGGLVIARHAAQLARAVDTPAATGLARMLPQFETVLPGATLSVPAGGAVRVESVAGATVLVAPGLRAAPQLRLDLCGQMPATAGADAKMTPLRIGYGSADLARWAGTGVQGGVRAVALAGPQGADMPKIVLSGAPGLADAPLRLRWEGGAATTRWIGDLGNSPSAAVGEAAVGREGWLLWRPDAMLHVARRAGGDTGCRAGQLSLQVLRPGEATGKGESGARALVAAIPPHGDIVSATLAAGEYRVPAGPAPGLEDQTLFEKLRQRGLLRLNGDGMAELAPRDLAAWRAAQDGARAGQLAAWDQVVLNDGAVKLLKHAYRMADGAYVREQLRIFNGEQRLLAWRVPAGSASEENRWQASIGQARASVSTALPPSAARLFAAVGEGWQGWNRIAAWAGGDAAPGLTRLTLQLPQPARAGQSLRLMLIGRALSVEGAVLRQRQGVCDGRACPSPDAAQSLVLDVAPGARSVALTVAPLDMAVLAMPGDQQYRHLRLAAGQLDWLPLGAPAPGMKSAATVAGPAPAVVLEDRNGAPLWQDGAPSAAASAAGLAPLLGIRADHAASVAGMLARLPAGGQGVHKARLTLDLPLQLASQRAIDCIGMRHGSWDGQTCHGGQAPPSGRHAGLVILDAETGDILAAAGAGGAAISAANWLEVRNFDRSDPARSPLRLPAFQHDGGAHASPGSTFKVISALGLEQAARSDAELDALLGGLPLGAINRMAQHKGFAFRTDSAVYPVATRLAHITNYKEQGLDRRAVDGRLGLAQALTYSLNTWFAWSGELSDQSLFGRAEGGVPDLQPLEAGALDEVRPIVGMARKLGFGTALRLDGGLLPPDYRWGAWDALQASASRIDPVHTRHELRQMAIGLRMQVTPLQMALAAAAVGQGSLVSPRLLLQLDARAAVAGAVTPVGVRLDRIRAGMKGVVDVGTAAGAFRAPELARVRQGLSGKTGTAPTGSGEQATVWFTGYLQPGSLPGQTHRLALAAFVSHSSGSGGEHAAPIIAAVLAQAARAGAAPAMLPLAAPHRVFASVATGAEQKGN